MDKIIFDKVDRFFKQYPKRAYDKDQIIIFNGDTPEKVFYIVSGKVAQYDISYRGDEIVTNLFKPPAFFPMSVALNHTENHFFYKADTPTVVYGAPPEDVVFFLKKNPDVMLDLLSRVYLGIDGVLGRIVHLMSSSAKSRLMYELVTECKRFGRQNDDGTYSIDITETHLASQSGMSRETVSREMKRLKEQAVIVVKPHQIQILDLPKFQSLLEAGA